MKRKIGVIGGGAAGMMAAVTAAREGADVTILEGGDRLGRKILSTGNGRCNLGNLLLDAGQYHGADRDFIQSCLDRFGSGETLRFFHGIGLMTKEKNGYLYPLCEQAGAVLDVLRYEVAALGIRVVYGFRAERIRVCRKGGVDEFVVEGNGKRETFARLILACGGKAAPGTGSDGSGYALAEQTGHRLIPVVPALTYLKCREPFMKGIAGVRTNAEISLPGPGGAAAARESGELQLTECGISGIPVFQLCRTAAYILKERGEIPVRIDLLAGMTKEEAEKAFAARLASLRGRTAEEFFTGMLNKKLMMLFLKLTGIKPNLPTDQVPEEKLRGVLELCRDFRVTVTGTGGFRDAQVCAGGVDTAQITKDMESRLVSGLYFAGELLDVDGRCGGYNLQWAWTSGYLAGKAAGCG